MKNQSFHFIIKFLKKFFNLKKLKYFFLKYFTNKIYFNNHFYSIINHLECYQRAINFETKEKDTLKWIDEFSKNDILFDIGANVGVYSLYASKKIDLVYAFEPHHQNYSNLVINKNLNNCSNLKAYCIAFSDNTGTGSFNHYKTNPGSSTSQLNINRDHNNDEFRIKQTQDIIIESISSFINKVKVYPNHIKIDVDGIEYQIIKGIYNYFNNKKLKSVLVEITGNSKKFEKLFYSNGFVLHKKSPTSKKDKSYNYIFRRVSK